MSIASKRREAREHRHRRQRTKIVGTPERPRLCVFRSQKQMYAQIVDDLSGRTLASASTQVPEVRAKGKLGTVDAARRVGELIGTRAKSAGIVRVVFDRSGYAYHGRIAALAEGARAAGIEF